MRAPHDTIHVVIRKSSLGLVLVAGTRAGLLAVFLDDDADALRTELARRFPGAEFVDGGPDAAAIADRVVAAIETPGTPFDGPLDLRGTDFQRAVWRTLLEIPPGTTVTYGEVAKRIGRPHAVRAVGTACGANHISVIVPCHRVLARSGALTGYRWGVTRKRELLARERAAQSP